MVGNFTAEVAANRFGLGARPGEIGRMAGDPRGALLRQLQGNAPIIHNATLPGTATVLSRAAELRTERREHRRANAAESATASSSDQAAEATVMVPEPARRLSALFRGL